MVEFDDVVVGEGEEEFYLAGEIFFDLEGVLFCYGFFGED